MKNTKRLISAMALLLAALMLFSSCAVAYRDVDAAEYVSLTEGFDYANIVLGSDVVLDKMIVKDSDVTAHINNLLYAEREAVKDGVNLAGKFNKYDMLTVRTFIYDLEGNLIKSDFALSDKVSSGDTGSINLKAEETAVPLGYGEGVNTALRLALEKALYLDRIDDPILAEKYLVSYRGIGGAGLGTFAAAPSVAYLTYTGFYGTDLTTKAASAKDQLAHFEKIAENIEKNGVGKNDYKEAVYLGLKELIERRYAEDKDNCFKPADTKTVTINVYPKGQFPANPVYEADTTHIEYDLDFKDGATNYTTGKIEVQLTGAVGEDQNGGNPNSGAFIMNYTYPSDETGTYKVGDEEKELKDREVVVYTYIFERAAYTRPEYNAETIKTVLNYDTGKTDNAEAITAYEAHIKTTLQEACDAEAKAEAKVALWNAVLAKTSLIKEPRRNIKNYVNEVMDNAVAYWNNGYSTEKTSGTNDFKYENFENFLLTYYCTVINPRKDADGKTISFASRDEFEAHLYEEGRNIVKNNLLTYLLADKMECRYTDDELLEMAKTRGAAWAKEQIEAGRKEITDYYTEENLTSLYPDTKASTTATKTKKQELFDQYGATSYEDCLAKMLAQTGYESWEAYALAAYPDDAATWEDYVEYKQGEENLYGAYHYERVLEKLYELNTDNFKYNEIPYEA